MLVRYLDALLDDWSHGVSQHLFSPMQTGVSGCCHSSGVSSVVGLGDSLGLALR